MHDPIPSEPELCFDFGITGLGASYHGDWTLDAKDERDHITHLMAQSEGTRALLLLIEDVLRLKRSSLADSEINALWRLTDSSPHDGSPEIGNRVPQWLDDILSVVVPMAEKRGTAKASWSAVERCAQGPKTPESGPNDAVSHEHQMLVTEVADLIQGLKPRQEADISLKEAKGALQRCAETVCSELAFRFTVCAYSAFYARLSRDTYRHMEHISARFGHGPHVVGAVEYLID
ncbi:hypothetical protein [Streptomyces spiramyceticus]|uniref:hypothetical protein n=1 Tax=Streptomyces spiramyceticus TaxID=299717 RepID=UPI00237AD838|nr:hypothetical protein [Streptomyces spiramyceticus]